MGTYCGDIDGLADLNKADADSDNELTRANYFRNRDWAERIIDRAAKAVWDGRKRG